MEKIVEWLKYRWHFKFKSEKFIIKWNVCWHRILANAWNELNVMRLEKFSFRKSTKKPSKATPRAGVKYNSNEEQIIANKY